MNTEGYQLCALPSPDLSICGPRPVLPTIVGPNGICLVSKGRTMNTRYIPKYLNKRGS